MSVVLAFSGATALLYDGQFFAPASENVALILNGAVNIYQGTYMWPDTEVEIVNLADSTDVRTVRLAELMPANWQGISKLQADQVFALLGAVCLVLIGFATYIL